jgi:hypothetical protein
VRIGFPVILLAATLSATTAFGQSTPSMNLEGTGLISLRSCSSTSCDEQLGTSVSGAFGGTTQTLNFLLDVQVPMVSPTASPSIDHYETLRRPTTSNVEEEIQALQSQVETLQSQVAALQTQGGGGSLLPGCLPASGTGTTSDGVYSIEFEGWFCVFNGIPSPVETISGWTAIEANALSPGFEQTWASGTLEATGWQGCCGGQYPILSNDIVVSVVGSVGQVYDGP